MTKVSDIASFLEEHIPSSMKEDYDNVGLLCGFPDREVTRILVVLDMSQLEVARPVLKKDGILITPEDVPADKLSSPKALNVMLLGALSAKLPQFPEALFLAALKKAFPEKLHEANEAMFKLGRNQ